MTRQTQGREAERRWLQAAQPVLGGKGVWAVLWACSCADPLPPPGRGWQSELLPSSC